MVIARTLGNDVQMQLGSFQFGVSAAAYQELNRTTEHTWAGQPRFGKLDALQYTGPGQDSITLPGVIYPEYRGGFFQLEILRSMAASGEPQLLMDGVGTVLGMWIIERVEERQAIFAAAGLPRRQNFVIQLRKFGEASAELLSTVAAPVAATEEEEEQDLSTDAGACTAADAIAADAQASADMSTASLTGSLQSLQAIASELHDQASSAVGSIRRGLDAAKSIRDLATGTRKQLQTLPTTLSARSGALNMSAASLVALTQSTSAQRVMAGVIRNLGSTISTPAQNILASAQSSLGALVSATRKTGLDSTNLAEELEE